MCKTIIFMIYFLLLGYKNDTYYNEANIFKGHNYLYHLYNYNGSKFNTIKKMYKLIMML